MKIYIASSWKNQHGVEMLTALLREKGHEVISWIENNFGELETIRELSFEKWMKTEGAQRSFEFDTNGAATSDLVIYLSPSGQDACAEVGIAWAKNIPIFGLYAKGEGIGLMRKMMVEWFERFPDLLDAVDKLKIEKNPFACYGNQRPHPMDFDTREEYEERFKKWEEWELAHIQF